MNKFRDGSVIYTIGDIERLRAENEALSRYKTAYEEWSDKTQWVQDTSSAKELGMHRADVLKQRIDWLSAENEALKDVIRSLSKELSLKPSDYSQAAKEE